MVNKKKPNLRKALNRVNEMPDNFFGNVNVDLSELPCLKKINKEKITANFDSDLLEVIRKTAQEHDVSYSTLMNDVLRKVFMAG